MIQIGMGIALIAGAFLARAKRYWAHGACQAAVLLLNLVMIGSVMWPSFHQQILPRLPRRLGKPYYAISTIHGILGAAAELLGLYILLVAGTNVLPRAWRFQRWKLWMRIELALWWTVLLAGIATYRFGTCRIKLNSGSGQLGATCCLESWQLFAFKLNPTNSEGGGSPAEAAMGPQQVWDHPEREVLLRIRVRVRVWRTSRSETSRF